MDKPLTVPNNLPAEMTSFVGRREELANIRRRAGTARLLTLTGPGGVGKTRLALRSARDLAAQHPDGVYFVPLAEASEPTHVTQSLAAALGLQERTTSSPDAVLAEHLRDKQALMILDNCEHLLDAVASVSTALLRSCPTLRILATSRQPLGVQGEVTEVVPSLGMPEPGEQHRMEAWRSDAVSLFVERAAARGTGFTLDATSASEVLELCRRLDGLPLALELAAVQLDAVGLSTLASRLDERLLALGGSRAHEARQRTMEATIDWSYRLLSRDEQLLWARASVFRGGFELDGAEQVCADDELPADRIFSLLSSLVEKSIVKRARRGDRDGFRMLEVLRQFGHERLVELGGESAVRRRHVEWIAALAAVAGAHDHREADAFARLRAERANLAAVLEYCRGSGLAERGITICADLIEYWLTEGNFTDFQSVLEGLLDQVTTDSGRAPGLWVSAIVAASQSDHERAMSRANEAVTAGRAAGSASSVALGLMALAAALWISGRPQEAIERADEAIVLGRAMAFGFPVLAAMDVKGLAQVFTGDIDGGVQTGLQTIALSEEVGELAVRGYALHSLAIGALRQGRLDDAEALGRRGIETRLLLGDVAGIAHIAEVLAFVASARRDHVRATTLLGGADAIWRSVAGQEYAPLVADQKAATDAAASALGQARYRTALEAGRGMDRAQVAQYALEGQLPEPSRAARPVQSELSARELEVARMVTEGATNSETASRLFISERTVESHVTNIFNKLGVNTRAQVAQWVTKLESSSGMV